MTHVFAVALAAAFLLTAGPAAQGPNTRAREIYVSVAGEEGNPVSGLTADDFVVREDGVVREVLKAGRATAPLHVALLVDDTQAASAGMLDIRRGLTAFVDALEGSAQIALITFGDRPTIVTEYTKDLAAVRKGIQRLFARPGAGSYMLEAILEASRGLARRNAERPTIVAITLEGVEFSNRYYEIVLDELQKSGAALHVVSVGTPNMDQADEVRNRNIVIAEGTRRTGGRRDQVLATLSLPDRMKQVAADLLNQYVVTYARPDTLIPPERVDVSVKRPGLTARARTRAER